MSIRKITYGGVLIAMAILLPQAFHLAGNLSGQTFLPMHIPVLLGGFVLGPFFGMLVGLISPIISALLTGMPSMARLPFMILELAAYGFFCGLFYETFRLRRRRFGVYFSLIGAMVIGRLVYGGAQALALYFFDVPGGFLAMIAAVSNGAIGIVIQLVFIPAIVYALERSGYLDKYVRKSRSGAV